MLHRLCALALLEVVAADFVCSNDDDCSLNGVCKAGKCECSDAWRGPTCGELDLQPARLSPNSGYDEKGSTSWGGSIVQDPETPNKHHMFVARMKNHCGMNSWTANSEIVRAVASNPEGPYKFQEVVVPAFAHGPSVRQLKDGRFLLMYLGCGTPNNPEQNCTPGNVSIKGTTRSWKAACNQFHISARTAPSLTGPWSENSHILVKGGKNPVPWWWEWGALDIHSLSNPAPYVLDNGSVALAFRATPKNPLYEFHEHVSVATADTFSGPYYDSRTKPAISQEGEDPYLWRDERGHWHILMHRMSKDIPAWVGGHAFSRDMKTWTVSQAHAYTLNVTYEDGSIKQLHRRERPQLLLDSSGRPFYFATGAWDHDDHAYTLVVKLGKGAKSHMFV